MNEVSDSYDSLKRYIGHFRVRELHDCLARLGLRTTGVKGQLVQRLEEYLRVEHNAGRLHRQSRSFLIVESVEREMRGHHMNEDVHSKERPRSTLQCVCQMTACERAELRVVTCVMPRCRKQEHVYCLFHSKQTPEWSPRDHHCIACRCYYADPFWINSRHTDVIQPTLIREMHTRPQYLHSGAPGCKIAIDGFHLQHSDLLQIRSGATKIQIVCLQLDDPVQFRFHWPINCKLIVNGKNFRVYARHADNKVTNGQRDEPADIGKIVVAGKNTIEISCQDVHPYAFCAQIVRPVDKESVLGQMHPPEKLDAAIMRMRRIVRSQVSNDVDDEVQTMTSTMSLKCPFSSKRIKAPARLLNVDSLECVFDLDAFITMVQKTRKWACPHSLRQSSLHHLARDVWLEAVLTSLQSLPEVHEIEVSKEGTWRLRGETKWRSVYNTTVIEAPPECLTQNKLEEMQDESEDEAEEMRKAAVAAKEQVKQHYQETSQCKNLEVVNLVSSDEETEIRVVQHPLPSPQQEHYLSHPHPPPLLSRESMRGARAHQMGFSAPLSLSEFHSAVRGPSMAMSVAERFAFGQPEEVRAFHPALAQAHPAQITSCHGFHSAQTSNYPPSGYYQGNFTVTPVQMHPREGTIFVKNTSISIPSSGIPKPNKRPGEHLDTRQQTSRRIERLNQQLRQTVVHDHWPVPQMECIVIDHDDSEKD